jgi:hypothetical protein
VLMRIKKDSSAQAHVIDSMASSLMITEHSEIKDSVVSTTSKVVMQETKGWLGNVWDWMLKLLALVGAGTLARWGIPKLVKACA